MKEKNKQKSKERFSILKFMPEVLEKKCYENYYTSTKSEGRIFYLIYQNKVVKLNPNKIHYLWEYFISFNNKINFKKIKDLNCIFLYRWKIINNIKVTLSYLYVLISPYELENKLEDIMKTITNKEDI